MIVSGKEKLSRSSRFLNWLSDDNTSRAASNKTHGWYQQTAARSLGLTLRPNRKSVMTIPRGCSLHGRTIQVCRSAWPGKHKIMPLALERVSNGQGHNFVF